MSRSEFSFELPNRGDNEPDLTPNQLGFIKRLADEVGAKGLDFNQVDGLGKWQASALIERLIEIRDGKESIHMERKPIGGGCMLYIIPAFFLLTMVVAARISSYL